MIQQYEIHLPAFRKGYHLITHLIMEKIGKLPEKGLAHIFIKHTSAAISINENADPSVRYDFESFLNKLIPEKDPIYTHILEGSDDMPAHLKSSLLGQSITIPIRNWRLDLGTWQGIFEFRQHGGSRTILITIMGE